jgi:nucleotide-binding universal stress UspA family protein
MRVLLAIDGSPESLNAAKFLANLPLCEKPQVTVVSVLVDTQFDIAIAESGIQLREVEREAAHQHYATVSAALDEAGMPSEHLIAEGHPNRILLQVGKDKDVDLIVLGARGHSLVARALLGSTSDYIANHARCPALVVRPPSKDKPAEHPFRVVLAYDGSAGSKFAAEQLFSQNWCAETEVQITTLLERPNLLPDDVVYDTAAIEEAEKTLAELVASCKCAGNVTYKVRETVHVGSAISLLAEKEHGDLIFVGETGKSALSRFFLGSAARHVLHHSPCSVWVARKKHWD